MLRGVSISAMMRSGWARGVMATRLFIPYLLDHSPRISQQGLLADKLFVAYQKRVSSNQAFLQGRASTHPTAATTDGYNSRCGVIFVTHKRISSNQAFLHGRGRKQKPPCKQPLSQRDKAHFCTFPSSPWETKQTKIHHRNTKKKGKNKNKNKTRK